MQRRSVTQPKPESTSGAPVGRRRRGRMDETQPVHRGTPSSRLGNARLDGDETGVDCRNKGNSGSN